MQTETADKLKELESELEDCLNEIEEAVISGNYQRAFKSLQKAKARAYIIKVQKLWSRGNRYFAVINAVKEAKTAFKKKNIKELEGALERAQNLLIKG